MLNEVGDVVSDTIIYFPLLKYHPESLYFIVAFIALSIINEYAGVMGKVLSAERRYDGPMGKSDRAFVLGLYGVVCLLRYKPFRIFRLYLWGYRFVACTQHVD